MRIAQYFQGQVKNLPLVIETGLDEKNIAPLIFQAPLK
jgi:hypothetical protein